MSDCNKSWYTSTLGIYTLNVIGLVVCHVNKVVR